MKNVNSHLVLQKIEPVLMIHKHLLMGLSRVLEIANIFPISEYFQRKSINPLIHIRKSLCRYLGKVFDRSLDFCEFLLHTLSIARHKSRSTKPVFSFLKRF